MKQIALLSLRGGDGATTVAVNLAATFSQTHKVMLWESQQSNDLSLYCSAFITPVIPSNPWYEDIRRSDFLSRIQDQVHHSHGVNYFPYVGVRSEPIGTFEHVQSVCTLVSVLNSGFTDQVALTNESPGNNGEAISLIRLPSRLYQYMDLSTLIDSVDLVIVVGRANAQTYYTLKQYADNILLKHPKVHLLLNAFQPEAAVQRDISLLLKYEYEEKIIPTVIHQDTSLEEAAAQMMTLDQYCQESQVMLDLDELSTWCRDFMATVNSI
jgi:hypothetical protein